MTGRTLLELLVGLRTLVPEKFNGITEKTSNVPYRIFKRYCTMYDISSYQAPECQEWFPSFQHYFVRLDLHLFHLQCKYLYVVTCTYMDIYLFIYLFTTEWVGGTFSNF